MRAPKGCRFAQRRRAPGVAGSALVKMPPPISRSTYAGRPPQAAGPRTSNGNVYANLHYQGSALRWINGWAFGPNNFPPF